MGYQVIGGATLRCTQGTVVSVLAIPPAHRVDGAFRSAANISDHRPMVNIQPFGLCRSPANPAVAAATAAAMGVLTPQPCLPVIPAPWSPGSSAVLLDRLPALNDCSTCLCAWAGIISVAAPGQMSIIIP